jgi:hypothetical protein
MYGPFIRVPSCLLTDFVINQFCDEIGYLEPSKIRAHLSHEEMVAVNKQTLDHIMAQVRSGFAVQYSLPHDTC